MYEQVEKPKENKSRSVANSMSQKKSNVKQGFGFVDNRTETVRQLKLKVINNNGRIPVPQRVLKQMTGADTEDAKQGEHRDVDFASDSKYVPADEELTTSPSGRVAQLSEWLGSQDHGDIPSPFYELRAELPGVPLYLHNAKANEANGNLAGAQQSYIKPKSVSAKIEGARRQTGQRESSGLPSSVGNLGDQELLIRRGMRFKNFQGGHLVGDDLMPTNISTMFDWNLAPQHERYNHPVYYAIEQAINKGALINGAPDRSIPITVNVSLSYDTPNYTVTVKDLIERGVVAQADVAALDLNKTITMTTRVPNNWEAKANIDQSAYPGARFAKFKLTDPVKSALAPAGEMPDLGATDFLVRMQGLGNDSVMGLQLGGGSAIGIQGYQGSTDEDNMAQLDPSALGPLPVVPQAAAPAPVFGMVMNVNLSLKSSNGWGAAESSLIGKIPGCNNTIAKEFVRAVNKRYTNKGSGLQTFEDRNDWVKFLKPCFTNASRPSVHALRDYLARDTSLIL